jgi:hypothetical protein
VNNKLVFILPLLVFVFPVARVFLLQPTGITLGESFSIGFFLISILLACRSVLRSSWSYAVCSGLFLALSAYFRSQFEIILIVLTGWGVLLALAFIFNSRRKFSNTEVVKSTIKTIAIVLFVAHTSMLPWRVYHWVHSGKPLWVHTAWVTFANSVMTSEDLEKKNGGFVVAGGGNLVCRIDPSTCGDLANSKKLFIQTFIRHPLEWYSLKLDVIGKYWFSSVENWTSVSVESTFVDKFVNGVFLVALVSLVFLLLTRRVRNHSLWYLLAWFNISLFSAYMLIFTVQQFETRYFYFPKIAGIAMILIVLCTYFQSTNKIKKAPEK